MNKKSIRKFLLVISFFSHHLSNASTNNRLLLRHDGKAKQQQNIFRQNNKNININEQEDETTAKEEKIEITIECNPQEVHVMQENGRRDEIEWHCIPEDSMNNGANETRHVYLLEGIFGGKNDDDDRWISEHSAELNEPTTTIKLEGISLSKDTIHITNKTRKSLHKKKSKKSKITTKMKQTKNIFQKNENRGEKASKSESKRETNRRLVSNTLDTRKVLVLRVATNDASNTYTQKTLSERIFGEKFSLASQYRECSYGKLNFVKATGKNIIDGIADISIPANAKGADKHDIMNMAKDAAEAQFGDLSSNFDHVLMCLPPGTKGYWIAFAYMPNFGMDYMSVYNDEWCGKPSATMHEVGHNLGLYHSNDIGQKYGDKTGLMGFSYETDDGPAMCFNSAKSSQLGWYEDRQKTIHPLLDDSFHGNLVGINDYAQASSSEYVILKIVGTRPLNDPWNDNEEAESLYMMFNRKEGINSETKEGADQVTIVRSGSTESELLALLSQNGEHRIKNFDGSGFVLVIRIDEISLQNSNGLDFATVNIFLDKSCNSDVDCNNGNICDGTERCISGTCQQSNLDFLTCDDGNPCTTDTCHPKRGCEHQSFFCGCGPGEESFELFIRTDIWGAETSWSLTPKGSNQAIESVPPNTYEGRKDINEGPFCIPDTCHVFTIKDGYGDGIDGGRYSYQYGSEQVEGPKFGKEYSVEIGKFCAGNKESKPSTITPTITPTSTPTTTPTNSPTRSPTRAPTTIQTTNKVENVHKQSTCGHGMSEFKLEIHTDSWGQEISWSLVDEKGMVIESRPENTYNSKESYIEGPFCFPQNKCYTLIMKDGFGDGIAYGRYSYMIDGTTHEGPTYHHEKKISIGACAAPELALVDQFMKPPNKASKKYRRRKRVPKKGKI